MWQMVFLNFTSIEEHCISVKKLSHVTNGAFEFYFNSGALHISKKTLHVWYGVLEFYLNSEALHFYKEKPSQEIVKCGFWCKLPLFAPFVTCQCSRWKLVISLFTFAPTICYLLVYTIWCLSKVPITCPGAPLDIS